MIVCRQFDRSPLGKSRGTWPQVYGDVEQTSRSAADELRFPVRIILHVQPAQRPLLGIEGDVALHEFHDEPAFFEHIRAESARKKAALIRRRLNVNDPDACQWSMPKDHRKTMSSAIGTTKRTR
jgi:hypothetical protein